MMVGGGTSNVFAEHKGRVTSNTRHTKIYDRTLMSLVTPRGMKIEFSRQPLLMLFKAFSF
jgi:hypothetical protein